MNEWSEIHRIRYAFKEKLQVKPKKGENETETETETEKYLPNTLFNQLEQCNLLFVRVIKGNWASLCHRDDVSHWKHKTKRARKHSRESISLSVSLRPLIQNGKETRWLRRSRNNVTMFNEFYSMKNQFHQKQNTKIWKWRKIYAKDVAGRMSACVNKDVGIFGPYNCTVSADTATRSYRSLSLFMNVTFSAAFVFCLLWMSLIHSHSRLKVLKAFSDENMGNVCESISTNDSRPLGRI